MGENEQGALLRNVAAIAIIGLVVSVFFTMVTNQKQSVHDTIARTETVNAYPQDNRSVN